MKIRFDAQVINEDTGEVLGRISSYDPTGFEHEMYKLEKAAQEAQEEDENIT